MAFMKMAFCIWYKLRGIVQENIYKVCDVVGGCG
jgi:hypothetical protein